MSSSLLSVSPRKYLGPAIRLGVAAAGLSLPRPLPPPHPEPSPSTAATCGGLGFLVGPAAGQLHLPCSARSLAHSLVVIISGVALGRCAPFQHGVPLL